MKNKIYYGDNLEVLRKYIKDESVDLCYIDPPFNSKRNYNQIYNNIGKEDKAQAQAFIDTWEWDNQAIKGLVEIKENYNGVFTRQSINLISGLEKVLEKGSLLAYLISMTLRIAEIQRILKETGSFYLHCDPTASHYLKLVCDAIFCAKGGEFRNEIIWKRTSSHNSAKRWGSIHDVILYYTKSNQPTWNRVLQNLDESYVASFYKNIDEKGRYRLSDLTGASITTAGDSGKEWRGINPTTKGRHWALPALRSLPNWCIIPENYETLSTQERLEILNEQGLIFFPKKKEGVPSFKRYLLEKSGVAVQDIINDINPLSAVSAEKLGYPTQKPEALLERIIKASSNEGDVVLDAYCGCGTTVAVAEKLQRNWIGIDITYQSVSLILKRLEDNFGRDFTKDVVDPETKAIKIPASLELNGAPQDFESAEALAMREDDRLRKEFEKWVVLTYSKNRAIINEKKDGDKGIDGIAYIVDRGENGELENREVLFSVKSNETLTPAVIRELNGTVEREKAACGILLTLYPMPNLVKDCKQYGYYQNKLMGNDYPKIQVISVEEILRGKRLQFPTNTMDVLKSAKAHTNQKDFL
ncbi:MAG: hypothetical protein RIT27_1892 [Pseudomonadota bacterium]|jgi:DNA modification methylase